MKTLSVNLAARSYPIYIGHDLLRQREILASHISGSQVLIVTQESIAKFYLEALQKNLLSVQADVKMLPAGEPYKNISEWQKIMDTLVENKHERNTTLIALGGGMVGDMAGFAAACYLRGVNYIQIPTSLIAQVDSAVGGKTGVNHASGKNLIGAFYQPQCVIVDVDTLKTLPEREFISGFAEMIKYGLIWDVAFFQWLEENLSALLRQDSAALEYAIERSLAIKSELVSRDERDLGLRQLLNFGHTYGHALETACAYQGILHGEAVAAGMLMAARLSLKRNLLTAAEFSRIEAILQAAGLLRSMTETPNLYSFMKHDKKVQDGKLSLILLNGIGQAVKISDATEQEIQNSIQ